MVALYVGLLHGHANFFVEVGRIGEVPGVHGYEVVLVEAAPEVLEGCFLDALG